MMELDWPGTSQALDFITVTFLPSATTIMPYFSRLVSFRGDISTGGLAVDAVDYASESARFSQSARHASLGHAIRGHAIFDRRSIVKNGLALFATIADANRYAHAATTNAQSLSVEALQGRFDQLFAALQSHADLLASARSYREARVLVAGRASPTRPAPSKTPISARATNLIVACEVTSQAKYTQSYQRPTWPGAASGVTVGIGYDVGYVTLEWLKEDWQQYASSDAINSLEQACGVTAGPAHLLISKLQSVVIDWPTADREFLEQLQPRYVGETESALPNTGMLSPDSLGALVSLVYNRGASFDIQQNPAKDPSDRYREMRAIKAHMQAKAFNLIPGEIRAMERLWKNDKSVSGLVERRELEASLFELGLKVSQTN